MSMSLGELARLKELESRIRSLEVRVDGVTSEPDEQEPVAVVRSRARPPKHADK